MNQPNHEVTAGGNPGYKHPMEMQSRCPVCAEVAVPPLHTCELCLVPHHEECWTYNERCAIFGCGAQPRKSQVPRDEEPPSRWNMLSGWVSSVLAAIGVMAFMIALGVGTVRALYEGLDALYGLHQPWMPRASYSGTQHDEGAFVYTRVLVTREQRAHLVGIAYRFDVVGRETEPGVVILQGRRSKIRMLLAELQVSANLKEIYSEDL